MSESGHDVEIFNVSRPGIGPRSYAHIAEVSIPLLDPNVVLVNILQGDDVMQAQAASIDVPQPLAITTNSQDNWISRTFSKYYPNVMGLFVNSASFSSVEEYQRTQRQVFQSIVDNYPEYPYENIDPEAYALFESGLLNPGILGTAIGQPDYFIIPTQLDTPETQTLLAALTESLSIIANQTSPEQVLVIAVPYRAFINAQDQQYLRSMGLSVNPDLLETSAMDDGIQMATEKADPSMLFLSVTDNFRASNEALYFQWDGHFNAAGSALFAHSIQPRVEEMCQSQGPS